jgi:hypothetical protein
MEKSSISINNCSEVESTSFLNIILAQKRNIDDGIKYLGFFLKSDCYMKEDWGWLVRKVEAMISIWVNRLLSKGGILFLLKAFLESILV